jgi:4-hydroxybenzoate polyprenyltransferase
MARLPNVPTVWSNVFTAWVLVCGGVSTLYAWKDFGVALATATMFYIGGTVINDCHDVRFDRQNRPERPIPAGRVSRWLACLMAVLLLFLATIISFFYNGLYLLFPLILLYTSSHKSFPVLGGALMGLGRWLLGFWNYFGVMHSIPINMRFDNLQICWALTLFAYVCTLSWIAMREGVVWRRKMVIAMLSALPLLDALFLLVAGEFKAMIIPLTCAGLAWLFRQVASPT